MTGPTTSQATGLTGGWLNAWLAAIGITRLLPTARLGWAGRATPAAVVSGVDGSLAQRVAESLPTVDHLDALLIARHRPDAPELPRNVPDEAFRARAALARAHPADWSLAATVTDLVSEGATAHGPFDPTMPKGITIAERVRTCRERLPEGAELVDRVAATLAGRGQRIQTNGLGFDVTRAAAGVYGSADVMVDPVVECLAFEGIQLFPVRGRREKSALQRGFITVARRRRSLRWPTWEQPLDLWGIDAILDQVWAILSTVARDADLGARPLVVSKLRLLGVTSLHGSVYQQERGGSDTYRAYGGERLW